MPVVEHLFDYGQESSGTPFPGFGAVLDEWSEVAMVRRHDDPVSVRADDGPRDFVWRGRRYTVCAVLDSWQERRAWWREVGDQPAGPGRPALPSSQRRVWRVEARPPSGAAGVFDLGRDDDHWLLLRAHD